MKRIALALIACAGLGFVAGRQPVLPSASQRSEVARPAVSEGRPVETPLVEKLLPKAKPQLIDGQLSPRGQWRWSEADWKWQPVKKAVVKQPGPMWLQNGHGATVDHLVNAHGYSRMELAGLTQRQLDVLHSNAHNAARAAVRSSCPNGNCPNTNIRVGIFGRRR